VQPEPFEGCYDPYNEYCMPGEKVRANVYEQRSVVWERTKTTDTVKTVDNETFMALCQRLGLQKHEYKTYFY